MLNEDSSAVCDAGEDEDVDVRDIDPFVENVDRDQNRDPPGPEVQQSLLPVSYTHLDVYKRQAQSRLVGQEPLSGLAVDAPVQAGDDGRTVLGEHEGVTFLELAHLGSGQDGNVVGRDLTPSHLSGLPAHAGDPDRAEQVGDLLVERCLLYTSRCV